MKLCTFLLFFASIGVAVSDSGTAFAQTAAPATPFTDPANLRGERIKPRDGHELPIDQGAPGLEQLLRKLNTRASLMNIVAHPDDEDGGMLTLYSRGFGARVADLSLNRGEGGQNAMTADFEDALGLIRTQEILACDRYSGVDQFFGSQVDYGFSKTKEEAFAKWDHDRVLYDVVRAIRLYHPMVLTSTWIGGVTDGHGQHQASGQIAQEAFKAAGDPTIFPELTAEGIFPYQPLRIYARVPGQSISDKGLFDYATGQYTPARFTNYVTGEVTTTPPSTDVAVHEGEPDKLLTDDAGNPLSYVQFARIGLGLQRSQVGGNMRVPSPGKFDVPYHLYGDRTSTHATDTQVAQPFRVGSHSAAMNVGFSPGRMPSSPDPNFFSGIDTSIESIATLAPDAFPKSSLSAIQHDIQTAAEKFNPAHPDAIAPSLAKALEAIDRLLKTVAEWPGDPIQKDNALHDLRIKRVQLNDALALALDIHLLANLATDRADALIDKPTALPASISPRQDIVVRLKLSASQSKSVKLLSYDVATPFKTSIHATITVPGADPYAGMVVPREGYIHPAKIGVPANAKATMPYFHRSGIEQPVYELSDPALRNAPATPPALTATFNLKYENADFEVEAYVLGVHTYPSGGTYIQPVSITPAISIASAPRATVFPVGTPTLNLTTTLRTTGTAQAKVNVETPPNWTLDTPDATPAVDNTSTTEFHAHPPASITGPQLFHITAETPDHTLYTESYRAIGYPGLLATNLYTPSTTRIVPVSLKLPAKRRIGYLPGTGDSIPEALATIGLSAEVLTVADLTAAKLSAFDSVILGVRTYAAHPDLHGAPTQALIDYAKSGGNVVVQYQSAEFTSDDAPYPLTLGRDAERVVDETDPVKLLSLTAPLLTRPNRITPADFNGWNEERGHGFLHTWDKHYTALTETHDPGENPQLGGLITTQLGSPAKPGRWTYCAFALYRQLPEAVPGAYRIFTNLLETGTPVPTTHRKH